MEKARRLYRCHYTTGKGAFFFLSIWLFTTVSAQEKVVYLYKGAPPGSETWNWSEGVTSKNPMNSRMAYNVTRPAVIVFTPDSAKANGSAVIIVPGGGFYLLPIEKETATARELLKKGVTVFLLKYRLIQLQTNNHWQEVMAGTRDTILYRKKLNIVSPLATSDVVAAVRHVRQHAEQYKIDRNRVGLIGFSAGAVMSLNVIYNADLDAVPDFAAINSGVMKTVKKALFKNKVPPLFIAAAADDQLAVASNSIELFNEWHKAKHPVELHIYAKGGHRLDEPAANTWVHRFFDWIESMGFTKPKKE
jgi:acetyl esterase/lipase